MRERKGIKTILEDWLKKAEVVANNFWNAKLNGNECAKLLAGRESLKGKKQVSKEFAFLESFQSFADAYIFLAKYERLKIFSSKKISKFDISDQSAKYKLLIFHAMKK